MPFGTFAIENIAFKVDADPGRGRDHKPIVVLAIRTAKSHLRLLGYGGCRCRFEQAFDFRGQLIGADLFALHHRALPG